MQDYTIALFGHRDIDDLLRVEEAFLSCVEELFASHPCINFLIGRNGDFDEYIASAIKRIQKKPGAERVRLILVLPYPLAPLIYYEAYYDEIIIPEELARIHPKARITKRNQWMIRNADLVLVCLEKAQGGTADAVRYALRCQKPVQYIQKNGEE